MANSYQMLFQLNASVGSGFNSAFKNGGNAVSQMQATINQLNKSQSDISAYQKQQQAIDATRAKLELYQRQYERLSQAQSTNATEEAQRQNAMDAKQAQIDAANAKLDQQAQKASEMGQALRNAGIDTNNLSGESARLAQEAQNVANAQEQEAESLRDTGNAMGEAMEGAKAALEAAGIIAGLQTVYEGLKQCAEASISFESSMAGVKRTVGGSDEFVSSLGESFKQMSTEMPITTETLASIATTAGQLGIAQENVESFTTVMAKLATTTDLSADDAATMLAQFANITGTTDYERLGSTVAKLGDSTATTASKVVEMSQGMAAAASIAGMSERDIIGISASVGSLGIEAAAGSTSMSTLISTLFKATQTGNKLEEFAAVAGMTGEEFKVAWEDNAAGALNTFIQGLNDVDRNGRSAVVILDELGITNVRQTKAILGLAQAGDLLGNSIKMANEAWDENTALDEKAGIMYGTTEAKMQMLTNAADNVKIAIGDALAPALGSVSEMLTGVVDGVGDFIEANPAVVQGLTAFLGVLGVVTAGITAYTAVTKLAAAASALFAGAIPGIGVILGVAAGIGLLVGGISALTGASQEATVSFEELDKEYDDLLDQMSEQKEILDTANQYEKLSKETKNLQKLLGDGFDTKVSFTAEVDPNSPKLSPNSFVDGTTVTLTPEQATTLAANDFLTGATVKLTPEQESYLAASDFTESTTVYLTPEQAETLSSSSFLKETGVKLTPEQAKYLKSDDFIDGKKVIELTPEQAKKLAAAGFMEGTTVELTAEAAQKLAAAGFLDGTQVTLTPTQAYKLKASEFYDESTTVLVIGEAGNTLTGADFGISDTTLTFIATTDAKSFAEVEQKAKDLNSQISSTKTQLNEANTTLGTLQSQYDTLKSKIDGMKGNSKQKAELQTQLEDISKEITAQEELVAQLEYEYTTLSSEYYKTATAANELKGKEEVLAQVKQILAGLSGEVSAASAESAEAFDKEAEAAQRDAEAQMALLRGKIYDNIAEQVVTYSNAVKESAAATEGYNKAAARQAVATRLQGKTAEEVNAEFQTMLKNMDAMEAAEGWSPDNADYQQAVKDAQAFIGLVNGMDVGDIQKAANDLSGGVVDWVGSYGSLSVSGDSWAATLATMNAEIVKYNQETESAQKTQNDFIQNLVNGVVVGAVTTEEVETRVREALKDEADAETTVAAIMADVKAGVEAAKQAQEGYAESAEEVAETSSYAGRSVDEIVDDLEALEDAYNKAYEAARNSMAGQFELFGKVPKKITDPTKQAADNTVKGWQKSLAEQKQYIDQYTQNYKLAQEKGVSQNILNQLSDGSGESAEKLANLANASKEEVEALNESYTQMQESLAGYGDTVAQAQTDLQEKLAALQSELETAVAEMDFSEETAQAAADTISAYAAGIEAQADTVKQAFAKVAAAAKAGFSRNSITIGGLTISWGGGFAIGTDYASPGFHLVGEEGPELMYFKGGEKVLTAKETKNVINANRPNSENKIIELSFAPQYHINGNSTADAVRRALAEQTQTTREELEALLGEILADQGRRSYA